MPRVRAILRARDARRRLIRADGAEPARRVTHVYEGGLVQIHRLERHVPSTHAPQSQELSPVQGRGTQPRPG